MSILKCIYVTVFLLSYQLSYNQTIRENVRYIAPFYHKDVSYYQAANKKYGLIRRDSTLITEAKFYSVYPFYRRLAIAEIQRNNGIYSGVINDKGQSVIPFSQYHDIYRVKDGFIVTINDRVGMINEKNKLVFPVVYNGIIDYNLFYAVYLNGKVALFNRAFKKVVDFKRQDVIYLGLNSNYIGLKDRKKTILLNKEGRAVFAVNSNFEIRDVYNSVFNNYIRLYDKNKKAEKIVDFYGKSPFFSNYKWVSFYEDELIVSEKNKMGVVSFQNEQIISPIYEGVRKVYSKIYIVSDIISGYILYGAYKSNHLVLPIYYSDISDFLGEFIITKDKERYNELYDKELRPVLFEKCKIYEYIDSCLLIEINGNLAIFNTKDRTYIDLPKTYSFNAEGNYYPEKRKRFIAMENGKYGMFTVEGKTVLSFIYEKLLPVYDTSYFIAKLNGKYGIINEDGKILLSFKYNDFTIFKEKVTLFLNDKNDEENVACFGVEYREGAAE